MKTSIVICTYQRHLSIGKLLHSITLQTILPFEIIIVDGSPNTLTEEAVKPFEKSLPLIYERVDKQNLGLTRQRNIGLQLVSKIADIVLFLDDDVVLEKDFLFQLTSTFHDETIIGADGLITNECRWVKVEQKFISSKKLLLFDGYYLPLSSREYVRGMLNLFPYDVQPGITPPYGHGKSALPPTGKMYVVDHLMGCMMAYRKNIFETITFSTYFEGYGLYEDYDFSIRAGKLGRLITNTAARLEHHHEPSGRPNTYKYGQMVVTNGWYVWRLKHPQPGIKSIIKWHCITLLLALFRMTNILTSSKNERKQAWGDFCGRITAWLHLIFSKPTLPQS